MKLLFAAIPFFLIGCGAVKLSEQGASVIALTEEDKPSCTYLSNVVASGGDYINSFDGSFRAGFNAAMNAVASAGGDAYIIHRSHHGYVSTYDAEAWRCGWEKGAAQVSREPVSKPQEIAGSERKGCTFITTIAEGSDWGVTRSRNYQSAQEDALNRVQDAGGDSYYIVYVYSSGTHIGSVGFIIEAWRCN